MLWASELAEIISLGHFPTCFVSKKWHWKQSRSNSSSCLAQFSSLELTNVLVLLQQLWSEVYTYECWASACIVVFESACQGLLLSLLPLKTGDWICCSASREVTQIQWCAFPSFLSFGSLVPLFPWKFTLEFQTFLVLAARFAICHWDMAFFLSGGAGVRLGLCFLSQRFLLR